VKKWEYMIIDSNEMGRGIDLKDLISGPRKEKVEKYLNQIGSEGWEVVNIDFVDELRVHFTGLAKREVER
jgi:hypothetical protein